MTWIFGSFLVTPCALTSGQVVISKQVDGTVSGPAGRAGVQPEGDHVIWEPRSQILPKCRELGVEPGIGSRSEASRMSLMIWLVRGCKRWHPLAPGRRLGPRRSPLSEYMSIHLSLKLTTNFVPLSGMEREREIFIYTSSSLFIKTQLRIQHNQQSAFLLKLM